MDWALEWVNAGVHDTQAADETALGNNILSNWKEQTIGDKQRHIGQTNAAAVRGDYCPQFELCESVGDQLKCVFDVLGLLASLCAGKAEYRKTRARNRPGRAKSRSESSDAVPL